MASILNRDGRELDLQLITREGKPPLQELATAFETVENSMDGWVNQRELNRNTRFCTWAGQTRDGRKNGRNAFPWKGASDMRVYAVDEMINGDVDLLVTAVDEADITGLPTQPQDAPDAAMAGQFMRWIIQNMEDRVFRHELLPIGSCGYAWMEHCKIHA